MYVLILLFKYITSYEKYVAKSELLLLSRIAILLVASFGNLFRNASYQLRKHMRTVFFTLAATAFLAVAAMHLFGLKVITLPQDGAQAQEESGSRYELNYHIVSPPVPKFPELFGEQIPVADPEVYERLDREIIINTYLHSTTMRYMKLAARWFPVIEPILAKNNIPEDMKYLAVAESGLENVTSYAGAVGFWQFMESTAMSYGLEVNRSIDERYNVEKATQAACDYLQDAYKRYGEWTLAAASYNAGESGINRRLEHQKVDNYWDLYMYDETERYILRIAALKYVFENPTAYGFYLQPQDMYKPYDAYEVLVTKTVDDLVEFAIEHGTTYKKVRDLNPWIHDDKIPNRSGRTYNVKLPQ